MALSMPIPIHVHNQAAVQNGNSPIGQGVFSAPKPPKTKFLRCCGPEFQAATLIN